MWFICSFSHSLIMADHVESELAATNSQSNDTLEPSVECPRCKELLFQPVTLLCQHSFCRLCLNEIIRCEMEKKPTPQNVIEPMNNRIYEKHAKCPVCQVTIVDPVNKINSALEYTITRLYPRQMAERIALMKRVTEEEAMMDKMLRSHAERVRVWKQEYLTHIASMTYQHLFPPVPAPWDDHQIYAKTRSQFTSKMQKEELQKQIRFVLNFRFVMDLISIVLGILCVCLYFDVSPICYGFIVWIGCTIFIFWFLCYKSLWNCIYEKKLYKLDANDLHPHYY